MKSTNNYYTSYDICTTETHSLILRIITSTVIFSWTINQMVFITKTVIPEWIDISNIAVYLVHIFGNNNV